MKRLFIIIVVVSLLLCGCGKKEEPQRFIVEYKQNFDKGWGSISIIRDTETGKSYILVRSGYGMGLLEVDNG